MKKQQQLSTDISQNNDQNDKKSYGWFTSFKTIIKSMVNYVQPVLTGRHPNPQTQKQMLASSNKSLIQKQQSSEKKSQLLSQGDILLLKLKQMLVKNDQIIAKHQNDSKYYFKLKQQKKRDIAKLVEQKNSHIQNINKILLENKYMGNDNRKIDTFEDVENVVQILVKDHLELVRKIQLYETHKKEQKNIQSIGKFSRLKNVCYHSSPQPLQQCETPSKMIKVIKQLQVHQYPTKLPQSKEESDPKQAQSTISTNPSNFEQLIYEPESQHAHFEKNKGDGK